MNLIEDYTSFLLRFWTTPAGRENGAGRWQAELESIQTGEQWRFASPEELAAFLVQAYEPDSLNEDAD